MGRWRTLLALAAVVAAAACLAADEPPRVGPLATVVLSPVRAGGELAGLKPAAAVLDSLMVRHLRQRGALVVPAESVLAVEREVALAIGGIYDPRTGRPIEEKRALWSAHSRDQVLRRFHPSLWLRASLEITGARFRGDHVHWDGVEEESGGRGGAAGLLLGTTEGTLPALSLVVAGYDSSGTLVHARAGGIRLMRRVEGSKLTPVPQESLLARADLNQRAVRLALDSLALRQGGPAER